MSEFKVMPVSVSSSFRSSMPSDIQGLAGRAAACLADRELPSRMHMGGAGKLSDAHRTAMSETPKQRLHEALYTELENKFAAAMSQGRALTSGEMISFAKSMRGEDGQLAFPSAADLRIAFSFCKGRAKEGHGQEVPMTPLEKVFLGACTQLTGIAYFFDRFTDMTFFPDEDNLGAKLESDW